MDALKVILGRRSCRKYTDQHVGEDEIKNLLRAGMCAPSAHNSQPWEFMVLRDYDKKKAASSLGKYWGMLKDASLGILVMANLNGYKGSDSSFFVQDCSAATENILLAAHAQGLSGVWLGLYPKQELMKGIRAVYGIPEHIIPFSIVSLGYPAEEKLPHRTFHSDKVHYDTY